MGFLQRFESRLEQGVSAVFAKAFRSAVQPVEVAAALQREVDNSAQILSRDRRLAPNRFQVELSPADHERLSPYSSTLAQELTEMLREHAQEQSYVFTGPVTIDFDEREDLSTGRFRVRSSALAEVTATEHPARVPAGRRGRAVLEVNGTRHPLDPPGLVVGRGAEADLRINDPGVSRRHVEIRVVETGAGAAPDISVIDLGSTNGMLVDGHKTTQAPLRDGATVKIGTTTLTVRLLARTDEADRGDAPNWGAGGV